MKKPKKTRFEKERLHRLKEEKKEKIYIKRSEKENRENIKRVLWEEKY